MEERIKEIIAKMVKGEELSRDEARETMDLLMEGKATDAQVASMLTALRMRGETPEEIAGFAESMRRHALRIEPRVYPILDTCGTGGDGKHTFNISTAASFIVAGAGVPVAKHGNRGVSSGCGSADVLEELGVRIDLPADAVKECIERCGLGFLFAPNFHPAMRHVMRARKDLGVPTVFNLLGPLANPAGVSHQLLGVGIEGKAPVMAQALAEMGVRRALVVCGEDGMDELSTVTPNRVWEVREGEVFDYTLDASSLGISRSRPEDLRGGDARENARIIREEVLAGKPGPRTEVVLLNAAAALYAAEAVKDLEEGLAVAEEAVKSGRALSVLEAVVEYGRGVN
ncbi:MAG: anthranilate phosphoribosyltransferase [Candidatus Geothermincolales bacterium]